MRRHNLTSATPQGAPRQNWSRDEGCDQGGGGYGFPLQRPRATLTIFHSVILQMLIFSVLIIIAKNTALESVDTLLGMEREVSPPTTTYPHHSLAPIEHVDRSHLVDAHVCAPGKILAVSHSQISAPLRDNLTRYR